jgi:broad specificity phosphatase PhoE
MRSDEPSRPSRFLLLRHGESTANVERLVASEPANARAAFGLTLRGREQVRRSLAVARAAGLLSGPCRVVSSPLLRALETAAISAELLGAEVEEDARLVERGFGELELGPDEGYEQVWASDRVDPTHRIAGVESVESIFARAVSLVVELQGTADGREVLLCTHGDVASVLLCAAQGLPLGRHREVGALDNGEIRSVGLALFRARSLS